MKKLFSTLFLFLSLGQFSHAEIFKWVDDKGKVHYGDKPTINSKQLNISEKKFKLSSPIKNSESREERRRRLTEAMAEDRLEKEEKKLRAKKKKEKINRQCVLAKDRLHRYKRSGSLYNFDKDGNRYNLSEDNRKKSISGLEKKIKKYCK